MKISINWLKDYVDVALPVEELAEKLTMAGLEVKSIFDGKGKDKILDIEVTPNRPDCLSAQGIAREVAAITRSTLHAPPVPSAYGGATGQAQTANRKPKTVSIEIQDKQGCLKYTARIISNIKVQPSPQWMQRRLLNLGLKPINNVVDITNYVMLEWGQPLHAFDFKKIKSVNPPPSLTLRRTGKSQTKKIIIRRAKKGEKIITLDNEEKELDSEILIIADSERPLAIAGLIGGENSGVNEDTNTILLESAHFEPSRVRKASRKLAISTESSYRFERGVNLEGVDFASERASELLEKLAEGKLEEVAQAGLPATRLPSVGQVWQAGEEKRGEKKVELRYGQVRRILGVDISEQRIEEILRALQFEITFSDKQKLKVKVPYFRSDIERESDLLEEIARIFGFQNIPRTMPTAKLSSFEETKSKIVDKKVKEVLISSGFEEVISNSLISKQNFIGEDKKRREIISIANPLTAEQEIMRPLLFFNALNILAWNFNHQVQRAKIFELGKVYYYGEKGEPCEDKGLAIALFGSEESSWRERKRLDFYELKGVIEKLLLALGISNYLFVEENDPRFSHLCAALKIGNKKIGVLGKVNEDILTRYDLGEDVHLCELGFKQLVDLAGFKKEFRPISKYPTVRRDIALLVKDEVSCKKIISLIRENGGELIDNIYLFDIYQGEQVPKGYKSLAFSIEYQGKERTLTDTEINSIDAKIRQQLFEKLGATGR